MRTSTLVMIGVMMVGCATTASPTNMTINIERTQPVASKSYTCLARYDGANVMYLACSVNPSIPGDTGRCNIEYYAESTLAVSDAGLFDLRCHDPDLPGADTSAFTNHLKLELLEAYSALSRMASR